MGKGRTVSSLAQTSADDHATEDATGMAPRDGSGWLLLAGLAVGLLGLAGVAVAAAALDRPLEEFLLDRGAVTVGAHAGMLSNAGAVVWIATAAIALFTGLVVVTDPARRRVLAGAGALVLVLGLDDLFLVHEGLMPQVLGIPEELAYLAYASAGVALLATCHEQLRTHAPALLALAGGFLAASVAVDVLGSESTHVLEDGSKWIGIVLSGLWLLQLAHRLVREERAGVSPVPVPPSPPTAA